MKTKILATIILCTITLSVFGKLTEIEKQNWEKLDWLVRGTVPHKNGKDPSEINLKLWNDDVYIALEGDHNYQDSLELKKIIKAFDKAIPFRNFYWAMDKEPTLVIYFTDSDKSKFHPKSYLIDYQFYYLTNSEHSSLIPTHKFKIDNVRKATLYLHKESDRDKRNKVLWYGFAKILVGNEKGFGFNIGKSSVLGGGLNHLTEFDRFFFRTIYSPSLKKQYARFLKSHYSFWEEYEYLTDEKTKTTIIFTLQLILFLLLTYYLYQYLWLKHFRKKVKSDFAKFHIIGLIFFIPQIIGSLFYLVPDLIKLEHWKLSFIAVLISSIFIFLIQLLSYFVLALIVYLIEHIIFKQTKNFRAKQLIRIFSITFCLSLNILPLIIFTNTLNSISIGVQIFLIFLAYFLIIITRFVYFHDQHQKEIIATHQQIKFNKLEQLQNKFQLEAIQARTNPHFLYNSLNTIASLAKQDANKTEDFALKLSKLLRYRLSENPPVEIPLSQEIETIQLYLEIEKERFSDRFSYSFELPEKTDKIIVPSFILLHLVENAIKHGISKVSENGEIKVIVSKVAGIIVLKVVDSGPDFPESPVYRTGIKNILEKLEILYPEKHEFAISNTPAKFVQITLNS